MERDIIPNTPNNCAIAPEEITIEYILNILL